MNTPPTAAKGNVFYKILFLFYYLSCLIYALLFGVFRLLTGGLWQKGYTLRLHVYHEIRSGKTPTIQVSDIERSIERLRKIYEHGGIRIEVEKLEQIAEQQPFGCGLVSMFSGTSITMSFRHLWDCRQVHCYFLEEIEGAGGCAFWGLNWCRVRPAVLVDDTILAHEIAHLLNLPHHPHPNNLMSTTYGETYNLTAWQFALMKTSPLLKR